MPADKDWTTAESRAELARLLPDLNLPWQEGVAGSANVVYFGGDDVEPRARIDFAPRRRAAIAAVNAVPALLARIERDEALLRRCTTMLKAEPPAHTSDEARALLDDLRAAGFAPEEE